MVLDADRHAVQGPEGPGDGIAGARLGERLVGVEPGPGPDLRLAFGDAAEAGGDRLFRGNAAFGDRARGLGGAGGHQPSRNASISGFCWPPSISIIVPLTKCASGEAR